LYSYIRRSGKIVCCLENIINPISLTNIKDDKDDKDDKDNINIISNNTKEKHENPNVTMNIKNIYCTFEKLADMKSIKIHQIIKLIDSETISLKDIQIIIKEVHQLNLNYQTLVLAFIKGVTINFIEVNNIELNNNNNINNNINK